MGKKYSLKHRIYYFLYGSQWVAGIFAAVLTILASKDPAQYQKWPQIQQAIGWGKENTVAALILAVYVGVASYTCKRIGPPWAWQAIKHVINCFQSQVMRGLERPKFEEHKVTLFRLVRWNFHLEDWRSLKDRSGLARRPNIKGLLNLRWFKPVIRSGHVAQSLVTRFPLFETQTVGEGVIGQVWRTQGVKRIEDLPQVPAINGSNPDVAYQTYADKVNCNEKWLRGQTRRTMARSYCGIPVEVNGNLWGVVIIDSLEPKLKIADDQIQLAAVALGKFIEKA